MLESTLQALILAYQIQLEQSVIEAQAVERPYNIESLIRSQAVIHGVDPDMAVEVARCESSLNPKAVGDSGQSRGLWQIFRPAHPTISDSDAKDPYKSTTYAMPLLKASPWLWTCWRNKYGHDGTGKETMA